MQAPDTGLKSNTKAEMVALLNLRLAEAIDLALITKQAHWNIKGETFIAVHEMLDKLRDDLDEHVDIIAERVAQLDGIAAGTVQHVAAASKLPPYPTETRRIKEHLQALVERYAAVSKSTRQGIDEADGAGDADSADILTAFSRTLDKNLWFLRSHLE